MDNRALRATLGSRILATGVDGSTAEFGIESYSCRTMQNYVQKTARRYCIFMQYFSQVNTSHFLALDFLRDSSRPNCPA